MVKKSQGLSLFLAICGFLFVSSGPVLADRDASFLAPSASFSNTGARGDGAIGVEPKNEIDLGETGVNVAKRTTLFFVNLTNLPVDIIGITANGDSNVNAEIVSDDCTKEGRVAASSRCAVTVEVTPKGAGIWTAEVLLTHNGAGRLTRAKLIGKTSASSVEKKDSGLSLSAKDVKPVDFGTVDLAGGKTVRSALMVNDSNEPITIFSIEVIAPENGLERLEQGCSIDMDLKPGESCPVTLLWKPETPGAVSTDLIIRHSGRLGFAVVPIRGTAKEVKQAESGSTIAGGKGANLSGKKSDASPQSGIPLSPTAEELEKMMGSALPKVSGDSLEEERAEREKADRDGDLHLIGTVGNRALFYLPDGSTTVAGIGEKLSLKGGSEAEVLNVLSKQAELSIDGKRKTLFLETVSALTNKAAESRQEKGKNSTSSSLKVKTPSPSKKKVSNTSKVPSSGGE